MFFWSPLDTSGDLYLVKQMAKQDFISLIFKKTETFKITFRTTKKITYNGYGIVCFT